MKLSETDWLSRENAMRLAAIIKSFWRDRGKEISVWTETGNGFVYVVRSELVNGLPINA